MYIYSIDLPEYANPNAEKLGKYVYCKHAGKYGVIDFAWTEGGRNLYHVNLNNGSYVYATDEEVEVKY